MNNNLEVENFLAVKEEVQKLYSRVYTTTPKSVSNLIFAALNNFSEAIKLLSEDKDEKSSL